MYNFYMSKERKEQIINNVMLSNKERMVFELLTSGSSREEITKIMNMSKRCVQYKVKKIANKISDWESNSSNETYYVYLHTFPNNKKYIGVCMNYKIRWGKNGGGYKSNKEMYNDILKYGWSNIKHEILLKTNDCASAYNLENKLIEILNLQNKDCGYNKYR